MGKRRRRRKREMTFNGGRRKGGVNALLFPYFCSGRRSFKKYSGSRVVIPENCFRLCASVFSDLDATCAGNGNC